MRKTWIWILTAVLLVGIIAGASSLYNRLSKDYDNEQLPTEEEADYTAPDFTVLDYNGNEVKLSDFKGKPVVLNFWATWCGYCKAEMPDFNTAAELYPDVQFMMINATDGVQETLENAKAYVEAENFTFDVFFDTNLEAVSKYYITGFPATIFIDKDGNLVTRGNGMLDYETLERGIQLITE